MQYTGFAIVLCFNLTCTYICLQILPQCPAQWEFERVLLAGCLGAEAEVRWDSPRHPLLPSRWWARRNVHTDLAHFGVAGGERIVQASGGDQTSCWPHPRGHRLSLRKDLEEAATDARDYASAVSRRLCVCLFMCDYCVLGTKSWLRHRCTRLEDRAKSKTCFVFPTFRVSLGTPVETRRLIAGR